MNRAASTNKSLTANKNHSYKYSGEKIQVLKQPGLVILASLMNKFTNHCFFTLHGVLLLTFNITNAALWRKFFLILHAH